MKVTLDLIITHYDEPFEIVKPLLESIRIQRNVDFNNIKVYIVNDGKDNCINPEDCRDYPFSIEFLVAKRLGVSNARNVGFEKGTSDYVMFCDCDDTFYHVNALNDILQFAENNYDIIINNFYEEIKRDRVTLSKHHNNEVFIHGKAYNRNFLINNNLRFNLALTVHEDYYFNKVCMTIAKNIICIDEPLYLWTSRKDSVCRKYEDYSQRTYVSLINVNDSILERFVSLGLVNDIIKLVVQFTYSTFFNLNTTDWENSKYLKTTELRFKEFFKKYRKYYDVCPISDKREWYNSYRSAAVQKHGMLFEPITFLEWINKILEVK